MSIQINTDALDAEAGVAVVADLAKAKTLRKWLELILADKAKFKVQVCKLILLNDYTFSTFDLVIDGEVRNMALAAVDGICTQMEEPSIAQNDLSIAVDVATATVQVVVLSPHIREFIVNPSGAEVEF